MQDFPLTILRGGDSNNVVEVESVDQSLYLMRYGPHGRLIDDIALALIQVRQLRDILNRVLEEE